MIFDETKRERQMVNGRHDSDFGRHNFGRDDFSVASHAGVFRGARFSSPKNAFVGG